MKTAESYLREWLSPKTMEGSWSDTVITIDEAISFINKAREDAIRECAERASVEERNDWDSGGYSGDYYAVDKNSILCLINELK